MKVKVKKWNAVATWKWDLPEDDVCGICQVHFDGTCPTCKYPGDDCSLRERASEILDVPDIPRHSYAGIVPSSLADQSIILVSGKCGHNFHMVSISHYLLSLCWYAELSRTELS